MHSQTIYSTRNITSWNKCRCGELFILRIPTMYSLLFPRVAKLMEANHWADWMDHLYVHVDETNKKVEDTLNAES